VDGAMRETARVEAGLTVPSGFDPLSLLADSHGYLVDAMPDEPVGIVDDVVLGAGGTPVALVVSCGRFGRRQELIPVDAVHDVRPRERRLRLWRTPAGAAPDLGRH
jgi:hypothetical protein